MEEEYVKVEINQDYLTELPTMTEEYEKMIDDLPTKICRFSALQVKVFSGRYSEIKGELFSEYIVDKYKFRNWGSICNDWAELPDKLFNAVFARSIPRALRLGSFGNPTKLKAFKEHCIEYSRAFQMTREKVILNSSIFDWSLIKDTRNEISDVIAFLSATKHLKHSITIEFSKFQLLDEVTPDLILQLKRYVWYPKWKHIFIFLPIFEESDDGNTLPLGLKFFIELLCYIPGINKNWKILRLTNLHKFNETLREILDSHGLETVEIIIHNYQPF